MDTEFFDEDALYKWEFKNKGYAHFDAEYCKNRVDDILAGLNKAGKMSHSFYPFIRFEMPKYKRDENGRVYKAAKPRYIMHTARIDANIYSFYRNLLMNKYDDFLHANGIADCVIAYRKIPAGAGKNKCNVHFANEAIEEIKRQANANNSCVAIALDISGFFDNLDHGLIKKQWRRIMGFAKGLPDEHFTIYKNITRFTYIDAKEIEKILSLSFDKLSKDKKKQICIPQIFEKSIKPHLSSQNEKGIPQGTTISDVIANMYMIDFDLVMQKFSLKYGGYYRRYSDDILFVCPSQYQDKAIKFITWLIKKTGKTLLISDDKTLISVFQFDQAEKPLSCQSFDCNGVVGKPFEYLGLSFDGKHTRIRQSTISAFYEKLSERIKKEVYIARHKLKKKDVPFPSAQQLYKMISFNMIRNSYMENREDQNDQEFLGNFYTYVHLVSKITGNNEVIRVYKGLGRWMKNRALTYCSKIANKQNFISKQAA